MSSPKFTLEDLENLRRAYASGVLRVRVQETETQYRSLDELQRAIEVLEIELLLRPRGPFFIVMGGR